MLIDFQDSRPIYEQIVDQYKLLILKGVLEADEQMPSVRALAMELSANPNTVQRAYAELEREGFLYSVKGRGSFVRKDPSLMEKRKAELRKQLEKVLREADDLGIRRSELLAGLNSSPDQTSASRKSLSSGDGRAPAGAPSSVSECPPSKEQAADRKESV